MVLVLKKLKAITFSNFFTLAFNAFLLYFYVINVINNEIVNNYEQNII